MGNDSSKSRGSGGVAAKNPFKSGPSNSLVQQHLENAKKSRVLQLKNQSIKSVPEQLAEVAEFIRNLDLSQNKIRELPPLIGAFAELKQLHISENLLESLPEEIGQLRKLEVLNVSQNKLKTLPEALVACSALKTINISQNQLPSFPIVLCHLRELDMLNISQNKITAFPDEISSLMASELVANQNQLSKLNSRSLVQCARLRILRVEENCLQKEEFDTAILQDSQVALIAYGGNLFQDRDFQGLPGYEFYQQRFTATRRKM